MLISANALWVLAMALVLDAVIGDPDRIWRRIPHPVALIGKAIAAFERLANRSRFSEGARRAAGTGLALLLVGLSVLLGVAIETSLSALPGGAVLVALLACVLIAQNSLAMHVGAVRDAMGIGLKEARRAVSMIVGRDPECLDEAGVARAAIESCAENFSDGVVAPAFWFAVGGLPGLIAYKAVNTADSMVGHRSDRYRAFGWASARLDDLMNVIPARLSGLLIALTGMVAGGTPRSALATMLRDAGKHRSPNAGWPEAAMAGALGLALAGPRRYAEEVVDDAFLNADGRREAATGDISRALRVTWAAWAGLLFLVLVGAAILRFA